MIHLAALIDVAESIAKPDLYFDVKVRATYNVLKASKGVSTFVFASLSAVYGESVRLSIPEEHPLNPKSPYAASKISCEAFITALSELYGFRPVILRLFNVYGSKQSRAHARLEDGLRDLMSMYGTR